MHIGDVGVHVRSRTDAAVVGKQCSDATTMLESRTGVVVVVLVVNSFSSSSGLDS